ncbi:MAG: CpsD/CapB family tyrosine-protein kinase [Pseudomonadota bacterium]
MTVPFPENMSADRRNRVLEAQARVAKFIAQQKGGRAEGVILNAVAPNGSIATDADQRLGAPQINNGLKAKKNGLSKAALRHAIAVSQGHLKPDTPISAVPRDLVLLRAPTSPAAEQFRNIRTHLATSSFAQDMAAMAIVSPNKYRPADFVAMNLGAGFAQLGHRVLIIDADMRHRRMERIFKLSAPANLRAVLENKMAATEAVLETVVPNLSVLPSGPAVEDPQPLFAADRFAEVLESIRYRFDRILVLSPPFGAVADGRFIWKACEGAFVVVRRHQDRTHDLVKLQRALREVETTAIGSLLVQ